MASTNEASDSSVFSQPASLDRSDYTTSPLSISLLALIIVYASSHLLLRQRSLLSGFQLVLWDIFVFITPSGLTFTHGKCGKTDDLAAVKSLDDFNPYKKMSKAVAGNLHKFISGQVRSLSSFLFPFSSNASMLLQSKKRQTPPGLRNPSNSCFQNSVLQALSSVSCFREFVDQTTDLIDCSETTTNGALAWLMQSLNDPEWQGRTLWTPPRLMPMNNIQQQDAQEYFSRIMDNIDKELIEGIERMRKSFDLTTLQDIQDENISVQNIFPDHTRIFHSSIEQLDSALPSRGNGYSFHSWPESGPLDGSSFSYDRSQALMQNPLDGLLAQRLICTQCHYNEGISLVPFNTLTVPLRQRSWTNIEVFEECLYDYLKMEVLDGVECAKCTLLSHRTKIQQMDENVEAKFGRSRGEILQQVNDALEREDFSERTLVKKLGLEKKDWSRVKKMKQLAIARAPKALVIHIQRSAFNPYTFRQEKNNSPVQYPIYQDMSRFTLGDYNSLSSEQKSHLLELWPKHSIRSILPADRQDIDADSLLSSPYMLRAVVGHSGTHDYGHYVCYRKYRPGFVEGDKFDGKVETQNGFSQLSALRCIKCDSIYAAPLDSLSEAKRRDVEYEQWWRLSDESVSEVTEGQVVKQANAFMLFYERCAFSTEAPGYLCQKCSSQPPTLPKPKKEEQISSTEPDDPMEATNLTGLHPFECDAVSQLKPSKDVNYLVDDTSVSSTGFSPQAQTSSLRVTSLTELDAGNCADTSKIVQGSCLHTYVRERSEVQMNSLCADNPLSSDCVSDLNGSLVTAR